MKNDATPETPPFATIPTMDLTLQWRELFKGQAVGQVVMHEPQLNLVQSEANEEKQLGTGVNWPEKIRDLFPFQLNVVEVRNGLVMFRAPGISTDDSLTVRDFNLQLLNLTNVQDLEEPAFADLDVRGFIMGNAPIVLTGSIDPNEMAPTFDIDLSIEGAKLVDVNPWLREFLKVDAEMGVFSMYSELAAAEGRFEGYVRPILEDPQFVSANEDGRPVPQGLGRARESRGENLGEQGGRSGRDADSATRRAHGARRRSREDDRELAAQRVRRRVQPLARRLDQPARRRERRALPLRRAAGRRSAGPRAIAARAPPRSLLATLTSTTAPARAGSATG